MDVARYFEAGAGFRAAEFHEDCLLALHFLDRVRERLVCELPQMRAAIERRARLGLGLMGFADLLDAARCAYGSAGCEYYVHAVGGALRRAADEYRGGPHGPGRRALTALPPTGGVALLHGASHAIEPHFREALGVSPEAHVRVAALWQQYVDNAVSKTVNLPAGAAPEDVAVVYGLAFASGARGVTVFRDGCLGAQPLSVSACAAGACE